MSTVLTLIPELEQVVAHGSREKCADILQRITTLFLLGAGTYNDVHVDVFDDVFGLLVENVDRKARAELSARLAPVTNAPVRLLLTLARDEDIAIAGPVLEQSPRLSEADLVDIAETKSQAHRLAISARPMLGEAVTEALACRGDREALGRKMDNRGPHFSEPAPSSAVKRAEDMQKPIRGAPVRVLSEVSPSIVPRDYTTAQRIVLGLSSSGHLTEAALVNFCRDGQYEEAVAALATLAKVPINVADRAVGAVRADPVLILCKAAGLSWPAAKAIFLLQRDQKSTSSEDFDQAFANYGGLSEATAQRVVSFWQARQHF
jgi:uncharacterized protein (DUF2336 family)